MTDRHLSEGGSTTDPAEINRVLADQFQTDSVLEGNTPSNAIPWAGDEQAEGKPAGVPLSELKPVPEAVPPKADPTPAARAALGLPDSKTGPAPDWAKLPLGLSVPKGRICYFIRIRAELTDTPWKGDRQAICWSMSVGDKRIALQRSMNNAQRASDEMVKQTIRAIDGELVSLENARIDIWWDEIGERGRMLLDRVFAQLHVPMPSQIDDFLKNCIEARSAG